MNREEHGSITPYQLTTIIVGAVIGVGVLAFPRIIMTEASTGGPIATLLGAVPTFLAWFIVVKLSRWYRGQTPAEYVPKVLTRPIGWLWVITLIFFLVTITAMTAREFGEVLKTAVLPNTPIEVTISVLLLTTAFFVRYDVQVFARVYEVFFPIMVIPIAIIGLLSLQNARVYYLFPPLGLSWRGLLRGAALASVAFVASVIGPFMMPSLNRPKQAVRAGLWGVGICTFVYLLVVTASLAVFGPEEMKRLIWPTLELVKTTSVPGFILERLEAAFIGIWVAAVFTTVGATYFNALLAITQLFHLGDHKVMAIPLVPILYMIAMGPDDIHALYRFVTQLGLFGVIITVGLAVPVLVVAWLRRKVAASGARQTG